MTGIPLDVRVAPPAIAGPWSRHEPERAIEQERLHRKQRLAGAYRISANSATARASPDTPPLVTPT
ncbi:hypothetical protein MXD63_29445 [Frankia sp. Cpl3]|uniref:hypothetical protein n=1 Tax=Parafrankia colletiae TaxID=573497 RepID=UPI001F520D03|nr:hypothetical protein [Parafrankia colletiae]MCK9904163.1 hypothetical protein [Frankia sp. Cpl3]